MSETVVCGEIVDHETRVTYEDSDCIQWECVNCGAEFWEDKDAA